jgi:REP element-mobilizing transposase RayT
MVLGHHLIISAYGFWLPNDPRGSWSDFVRAWELVKFGEATKVDTHRSVAAKPHDRRLRIAAKQSLKYPAVEFTGPQAKSIGAGFWRYTQRSGVVVWACSILPDHVHLVVRRHSYKAEIMMQQFKGNATAQLNRDQRHPLSQIAETGKAAPSPWGELGWKVFLDSDADIWRAIRYVENNPLKEGKPRQTWSFVSKFMGYR